VCESERHHRSASANVLMQQRWALVC